MRLRHVIPSVALLFVGLLWLNLRSTKPAIDDAVATPATLSRVQVRSANSSTPPPAAVTNLTVFQKMVSGNFQLEHLSHEQVEAYLKSHQTNAASLLAAWHAAGGLDYLKRAAELFPDDPRVQVAVLNMNLFPEQQREWLDRLKQSDPENPMGNYLSARDYLHSGNPEQALKELKDATGKSKYNDYTLARLQDTEEMYMQAGHSAAEAKAIAGSSITLPQVTQLRDLGRQLATLQQNYLAAGDQSGAEQLARMGDSLSRDMGGERAGAGVLINQLAGMAVEKSLLKGLPPDSEPEFLGVSVQQRLAQIEELKMQSRTLVPLLDQMLLRGNEAEIIGYFDRMKMYGELRALKWLADRPPGN